VPDDQAVDRLGAGREVAGVEFPDRVATSVHQLKTADGAAVHGVLHRLDGATTVVSLMHPRQQLAHHPMIAYLLHAGCSVWTQNTRSPNNDINLVHEQALLDVAAGQSFLRNAGFEHLLTFGHSGGGALFAYYIEQAATEPQYRFDTTPAGRPIALPGTEMPIPDGALFLAPHPGQGIVLRNCIDPSIGDATDPLSVIKQLNMFDPVNGFCAPGTSSNYPLDFLTEYRTAQLDRIKRIDALAREYADAAAAARDAFGRTDDVGDRRVSLAPRIITTYRTDADPRYVDLSIDPNDRRYGSLFGRRPDLTNYGLVGFGRLTTADAWLSTWSALSSRATFERCAAGIYIPTLYIAFSGDQAAFPPDITRMFDAIASSDKTRDSVAGQHFGQPLRPGEPTGYELAAAAIAKWVTERYPVAT